MQKYKRGANRISTSRLWNTSHILDLTVSYFSDDILQDISKSSPPRVGRSGEPLDGLGDQLRDPMARHETFELVRTYHN